ncbi:uncharacterized protein LOC117062213 [Trachypithecus francoisi]|uniref:uncharacterized protein LOC117062213 n=1 Tax=Trachypithecus francoisi TaxID=54180 RepID=UPI00141BC4A7|nr:uncharacterized protein LOC117062213 [Trachypithecus francoisi]
MENEIKIHQCSFQNTSLHLPLLSARNVLSLPSSGCQNNQGHPQRSLALALTADGFSAAARWKMASIGPPSHCTEFQESWPTASQLLDLCDSVKDDALRVIPAFNIPHTNLHAPIAGISNPWSAWAFYPAPLQPLPREGARSQRPKLGAKL